MRTAIALVALAVLATTVVPAASADIFVEVDAAGRDLSFNDPTNCPLRISPTTTIGPLTFGADGISCGVIVDA